MSEDLTEKNTRKIHDNNNTFAGVRPAREVGFLHLESIERGRVLTSVGRRGLLHRSLRARNSNLLSRKLDCPCVNARGLDKTQEDSY